jgi:hypothetical protein
MALPIDQMIREQRFIHAHPEWQIYRMGHRFNATRDEPNTIVVRENLRELLDDLDDLLVKEAGQ